MSRKARSCIYDWHVASLAISSCMSVRCQPEPFDGLLSASPGDPALVDRRRPFCSGERGGRVADDGGVTACRAASSSICETAFSQFEVASTFTAD